MEHVVFFPAHDGAPAFRRVSGLEEAVRLVEHLRNVEGIAEVSCHALTEVPLAFKAYYRVEVPEAPALAAVPDQPVVAVAADPVVEVVEPVAEVLPEAAPEMAPAMAAPSGPSSLGFFSR